MTEDAAALRAGMVNALVSEQGLNEAWRDVLLSVPRHAFLPDRYYVSGSGGYRMIDRGAAPDTWLTTAYANQAAVTQFDAGPISAPPRPGGDGHPTSSASQPSLVAAMLEQLDVRDGHRVLEVGTGTGYHAALFAARLGDRNVTTIEIDPTLAQAARGALAAAGYHPHVVCGDGAQGYPPHAPYDRLIATCSVRHVPYAWVAQTNPGGTLLIPRTTTFHNYGMVALTVTGDGTASGPFVDPVTFMHLRAQQVEYRRIYDQVTDEDTARERTTTVDPRVIIRDFDAEFALSLQLPNVLRATVSSPDDDSATVWFVEQGGASWAAIDVEPGASVYQVSEQGPRDLWAEVEIAYTWWHEHDRPGWDWFGLTVTPERQYVWYDTPDSPHTWPVPAP